MRAKKHKALRAISLRLAAMQKLDVVNWTAKKHPNRKIKVPMLKMNDDGTTTTGYEHKEVEVFQILLGNCARRIYQTMKKRFIQSTDTPAKKHTPPVGGFRSRIRRKQQSSHFIKNSSVAV